ncbi:MAG: alcohol dehydrogenase catalytic domain-containing protein [Acidobacteriota bacterium]
MSRDDAPQELVGLAVEAAQPNGAAVGRVDDVGEKSSFLLGKRVLVGALDPCGQCDVCRRGGAAVCPAARPRGPVGPRLRAASRWLVALDDGLELPVPAAAAVGGDVATAYTLYARAGLQPRDPAVVTGATAVTRFLVEILAAKSIAPTVVADPDDRAWCDWLLRKGAAVARDAEAVGAAIVAQGLGARPWRVLATDAASLPAAAALAGPRATLAVLATGDVPALPGALLAREVAITGVAGAHPDLIVEAAAMCAKGEIDLAGGVTTDASDRTRAYVIAIG